MTLSAKFDDSEFQAFVKNFDKYVKDDLILKELEKEFQRVTNIAIRIEKRIRLLVSLLLIQG